MSQTFQTKQDVSPASGKSKFLSGNLHVIYFRKFAHKIKTIINSVWKKSLELFGFLPIRVKLSLILAGIVISVLTVFSLIVYQTQKRILMDSITQTGILLSENLSESVYGNLLDGNQAKVKETVFRLKKNAIKGLIQVAIVNRKEELVAAFDTDLINSEFENKAELLKYNDSKSIEKSDHFEFYHPIIIKQVEDDRKIKLGVIFLQFSKDVILTPLKKARNIGLGSAFIITLLSIVITYLIAKRMVHQIHLLSRCAREVGNGNLDTTISVNSKDELGQLTSDFNNMIRHLREKSQMQKFVSKLTVEMIKDTVHAKGKSTRAIKRNVAVLFSDIRNFSSIAEKLAPEEIVKLINIYFNLQTKIIESHNGIVDKFMGDQIMAIFEGSKMADNALRAGVEIQRQIKLLNQERHALDQVTLEMGIGINNGAIVMGHMGSENRMDYTVIGDVVNVAARLCTNAKSGQIITSFELTREVNGSYPTTRLKSISVKGRIKSIDVCEVDYDRDILM